MDTISVARRLQEDFGMPEKQAEGVAVVLHENFVGNVATKDDLDRLKEAIDGKFEALDGKMEALEERVILKMTVRLGGIMVAIFAFFEVLNRVFPIVGG